jgi:WD40 repeat protein
MGTLKLLDSLKGFLLAATSVAFSHDSRRLAASSNGQEAVKLWDTETRQEVLTSSFHPMAAVCWRSIASASPTFGPRPAGRRSRWRKRMKRERHNDEIQAEKASRLLWHRVLRG